MWCSFLSVLPQSLLVSLTLSTLTAGYSSGPLQALPVGAFWPCASVEAIWPKPCSLLLCPHTFSNLCLKSSAFQAVEFHGGSGSAQSHLHLHGKLISGSNFMLFQIFLCLQGKQWKKVCTNQSVQNLSFPSSLQECGWYFPTSTLHAAFSSQCSPLTASSGRLPSFCWAVHGG